MLILICFLKTRILDDTPKRHETRNETQVTRQYLHNLIFHLRLDWPLCPFICPQTLRWIRVSHEYFLISDCHSRYLSKSGLDWNSQSSVSKDFSAIVLFMIVVITKTLVGCYKDPKIFYRPSYLSLQNSSDKGA